MKRSLFDQLRAWREAGMPAAVVSHLGNGQQALVSVDAVLDGDFLSSEVLGAVRARLHTQEHGRLPETLGAGCADYFVRVYGNGPRLLLVGAVHIAQALTSMARTTGFEVTVIDPRRAFLTPERFPGVARCDEWPDEALTRLRPDAQTAVVTLTHDPKLDDPALLAALESPAFYIGALGSRRTHTQRLERLGQTPAASQLHRIHGPVGLDLGGRRPPEIAVSIIAQILQVRYRGHSA